MKRAALALLLAWTAVPARAQLDPERRRLLQFGYDLPLDARGPLGAYAFYYFSDPEIFKKGPSFRIAVAPVYLDSETGFKDALGPDTDLGLGLAGGAFAQGHAEMRQGRYVREESFEGDGFAPSVSVYHLFDPGREIPLSGLLRAGASYSTYGVGQYTAPKFELPADHVDLVGRAGLRLGGEAPELSTKEAMELSAWYEGRTRSRAGDFGYAGDRRLNATSHLFWARALIAYTLDSERRFEAAVTAGTSLDADRLNAYYLGGELPLAAEFPLGIPGYFNGELAASRFVHLGGRYDLPLAWRPFKMTLSADAANVRPLPGMGQSGPWNSGASLGTEYAPRDKIWKADLAYAYGFRAKRGGRRGAQAISLLVQWDLGVRADRARAAKLPPPVQTLHWLKP
jgi:hypothetical protein